MRFTALIFLSALTLSAQDITTPKGANLYSVDKEAALGAQMNAEVRRNVTVIDNAIVIDFVNRIGSQLAPHFPSAPFPFTFTVVAGDGNNSTHEPISLPGGYIFVPADLILAARDQAEFAGMLAHSMAHVAARHATRQASRQEIGNLSTIPLIFMGGWAGYSVNQSNSVAVPVSFLKFQREMEMEADIMTVAITSAAGFDPSALGRYLSRVPATQPGTTGKVFAPLPPPEERVSRMDNAIQSLPQRAYSTLDPLEFARIQAEVRSVLPTLPPRAQLAKKPTLKRDN
jgi:predicted Zn-dependent protease